jgi:hypothetical protein
VYIKLASSEAVMCSADDHHAFMNAAITDADSAIACDERHATAYHCKGTALAALGQGMTSASLAKKEFAKGDAVNMGKRVAKLV